MTAEEYETANTEDANAALDKEHGRSLTSVYSREKNRPQHHSEVSSVRQTAFMLIQIQKCSIVVLHIVTDATERSGFAHRLKVNDSVLQVRVKLN